MRDKHTNGLFKPVYIMRILGAIILAPIVVNLILLLPNPLSKFFPVVGEQVHWLVFWGSCAGAIIAGIITLFVLDRTLQSSSDNHIDEMRLHRLTAKYHQKQNWVENLRNQLIRNYAIIDLPALDFVKELIENCDYSKAIEILLELTSTIDIQPNMADLYLPACCESEEKQEYYKCFTKVLLQYGDLLVDFVFAAFLLKRYFDNVGEAYEDEDIDDIHEVANKAIESYRTNKHIAENDLAYLSDDTFRHRILKMNSISDDFKDNCMTILYETSSHMMDIIRETKLELGTCARKMLKLEEENLDKMLDNCD